MNSPIIITTAELAKIFAVNERTIAKLVVAGVIEKVRPDRHDLIASVTRYVSWLCAAAAQHNTKDAKEAALQALTALRDAQRFNIEQKSKDYVKRSDVLQAMTTVANEVKAKLLELPLRLRQRIEDNHPTVFPELRKALAVEDDFDVVCCEILAEIADLPVTAFGSEAANA
jgi:phage terminase Nu1 subunit (DNA packaging protein)